MNIKDCQFIAPPYKKGDKCPAFRKRFTVKKLEMAELEISSLGVYEAESATRRFSSRPQAATTMWSAFFANGYGIWLLTSAQAAKSVR